MKPFQKYALAFVAGIYVAVLVVLVVDWLAAPERPLDRVGLFRADPHT